MTHDHPRMGPRGSAESIAAVPVTTEEARLADLLADDPQKASITLSLGEWAAVIACLRGAVLTAPRPGLAKVMHDRVMDQIKPHLRKDAVS